MKRDLEDWFLSQRWLWRKYYNHYNNKWTYENIIVKNSVIKCHDPELSIEEIKRLMHVK